MLSDAVELAAFASFDIAAWLHSPIAGLVVLGAVLWLLAQALDGVKVKLPRVRVTLPKVKAPRVAWPRPSRPGARET